MAIPVINLSSLDGSNGFRLDGVTAGDRSGFSVSGAGDVNKDGFDDVIVGAPRANPSEGYGYPLGSSYLVFGKASGFDAAIELSSLDGSNGFRLDGGSDHVLEQSGSSVSNAGDFNGDGYGDLIIGAPQAASFYQDSIDGFSYVVFGKATEPGAVLDLSSLQGDDGFGLDGPYYSAFGCSVSSAGDINGDGLDDVIIGARFYRADRGEGKGASYVIFGKTSTSQLNGFSIIGNYSEFIGASVSSAGDINGDGYKDIVVGASGVTNYVIFGKASGFDARLDLSNFGSNNGFRITGESGFSSVSDAGDVNGDGIDDLVVGNNVIFGRSSGFDPVLEVANLDGNSGFRINGSGGPISSAGDVNGDGIGDLIIGGADVNGDGSGTSYVMFGKSSGFGAIMDLSSLDAGSGLRLDGVVAGDGSGNSVSGAGDINGDGFDDLIVGAQGADPNGIGDAGSSYVLFGDDFTNAVTFLGTVGDDSLPAGSSAAEYFVSGKGNDTMSGGGGADSFHGGEGDDIVEVSDLDFQTVDGGNGSDALMLAGENLNLILADLRTKISGIERIDLTGSGDNMLTINALDLLNLSNTSNTLRVDGNSGDKIVGLGVGWSDGGISGAYRTFIKDEATLQVNVAISIDFPLPGIFDLSHLNGSNGFRVDGIAADDYSGHSVSSAGDVNGDGLDDLILSSPQADSNGSDSGASYVVFGKSSGFDAVLDLSSLDGSNGFRLNGVQADSQSGFSVSNAGDVNGDGIADLIIGSNGIGASVVFGQATGFGAELDLSSLNGSNGFHLRGGTDDQPGKSVSGAGDINGDGYADLIVDTNVVSASVVFGRASGFGSTLDLSDLNGNNGFHLRDGKSGNGTGKSVSGLGDINGDGYADLIVGVPESDASYVMFGKASGFSAIQDLSTLDGSNGFRLDGSQLGGQSGWAVSNAGDVNGDHFDDLIIGVRSVDSDNINASASYVVFGKASGFDAVFDLSSLDGNAGFRLVGVTTNDQAGWSVNSAGDFNGDGFDDLLIGAPFAGLGDDNRGASYLLYGKASGFGASFDLSSLDSNNGFRLDGIVAGDGLGTSISSAGDLNGDGFSDLIVGAPGADPDNRNSAGSSYVLFGGDFTAAVTYLGTLGNDSFTGNSTAESFVTGDGNDIMVGGGGADVFHAGAGDDVIVFPDFDFQFVDGGTGIDTLVFSGNVQNLDLADLRGKTSGIESIDLTDNKNNELTFTTLDLINLSDDNNLLRIEGNVGDRLFGLSQGWVDGGFSGGYHIYMRDAAVLQVSATVSTDFPVPGVINLSSLDGSNGFRLDSMESSGFSGFSVSSAGDMNGDGFDDVIIGAREITSYVVFGKASGFSEVFNLPSVNGSNGFRLNGNADDGAITALVSNAGDINGDGFDDVIVGGRGSKYAIFGKASGFSAALDLSKLDGREGFRLRGGYSSSGDFTNSISSAGDVNGDGFDDLIIGSPVADPNGSYSGSSYVIFGKASGFDATFDVSKLNGNNGFRLDGIAKFDRSGSSVSSAGDINGDGFDDLIIGAFGADAYGLKSGASYVVFGKAAGFSAAMDLSSLDGTTGFRLHGVGTSIKGLGWSVSDAGDINGDGFGDLIVGGTGSSSFIVFGKNTGFDATLELSSLDGTNGFHLSGNVDLKSVSGAGDVNGDGFDDLVVGADSASPNGQNNAGTSYVIFGKASGFSATMDLTDLEDNNVLRLNGVDAGDSSGVSVSSAGDVNGDGLDDILIGAWRADPGGDYSDSGSSYVIFGRSDFGNGGLPEIKGTSGDDLLKGSTHAEHFIAGDGSDSLLGRGGADVFDAGAGNDAIRIGDLTFASIDGGDGNDALHLAGSDLNLDLTTLGDRIHGIETICLYGRGDNTLTLTADSLLNLSDSANTLKVHGNSGDHITVQDSGWVDGGSSGFYHTYTHDDAMLLVGANVTVDFVQG